MEGNERFKPYNHREMAYEMEKLWKKLGIESKDGNITLDFVPRNAYLEEYEIDYGRDTLVCFDGFVGFAKGSLDEDSYEEEALDGVYNFLRKVDHFAQELVEAKSSFSVMEEISHQKMLVDFMAPIEKKHTRPYVALLMEYCNEMQNTLHQSQVDPLMIRDYLKLLSAFAPVVAENSFQMLLQAGIFTKGTSILLDAWPEVDPEYLETGAVEIPVQIQGKTKAVLTIPKNASKEEAMEAAKTVLVSQKLLGNAAEWEQYEVIYVPGKIMNLIRQSNR